MKSHSKFYAALILGKPSLRCKIVKDEPEDVLEMDAENTFKLVIFIWISDRRFKL